jgi:UDP-2,3-diacylglucosamine hydrolase
MSGYLRARLLFQPTIVQEQGLSILVAHGDGLIHRDRGYLLLKKFLRWPVNIWLFKLIHPDLGSFLARHVSRISRRWLSKEKKFDFRSEFLGFAGERFTQGLDAIVVGHSHKPFIAQMGPRQTVVNSGDWITNVSYVVLRDGKFELKFWDQP